MSADPSQPSGQDDPGYARVRDYLLYGLSLPERTLRSAAGAMSGALRESASLLVPQAFQDSKTYNVLIRQTLDFVAEDIGGVQRVQDPNSPPKIDNFVARKAVGNFIEMAGLATLHLSPIMLLAIISDVAYGSQTYLKEVADDLKQQGIVDCHSTIDHVDDLLAAVADAARTAATAFDTPPLSVEGLRETIDQTREAIGSIDPTKVIPQAEVRRLWEEIQETAKNQGVNPFAVSSAMTLYSLDKIGALGSGALSTVKVAGRLFDRHILEHYSAALGEIQRNGLYATLAVTGKPYIDAVWLNFSSSKSTFTEDLLRGRMFGQAWGIARRWLAPSKK